MDFSELWDSSRSFRNIFVYRGLIKGEAQKDLAESFWIDRFPELEWGACSSPGCGRLAVEGEKCTKHSLEKDKKLPRWKWDKGRLYRFTSGNYIRNDRFIWMGSYGDIPQGYVLRYLDRNGLNQRAGNLVMLSRISAAAADAGVIEPAHGVLLDNELSDYFIQKNKPSLFCYGMADLTRLFKMKGEEVSKIVDPGDFAGVLETYRRLANNEKNSLRVVDIADAAGVSEDKVRAVVSGGKLNVWSLKDIVKFCKKGSPGRPKVVWEYNLQRIADEAGVSLVTVYNAVNKGALDPESLISVGSYCKRKRKNKRMG